MSNYTRSRHAGGTYFFSARAARRGSDILLRKIDLLRNVMRQTHQRHPFEIEEIVVLGDAIHTIWTLPEGDADYSKRWRMVKSLFSRACPTSDVGESMRLRPGEKGIWQRRFWEHAIRDKDDFEAHRHMIFSAPVQAGLVRRPIDWPHSSVHRAIGRGTYDPNTPVGTAYGPWQGRRSPAPNGQTTFVA
ncbi:REP-associated tyrosine transposase [Tateyamaria sp.]|uniref:REP-associated tyrosine transposase n=1 Tax=Tateyamaria sp. TaxID=1929288 RepID=UPI00329AA679